MLTQVNEPAVAGTHGVEWDAVELPSQFMENFAWEWEVLQLLTGHVDTGAPLPRCLFEKVLAAKNFQSGIFTVRQLEFACLTCCCTPRLRRTTQRAILALLADVRREVSVMRSPEYNRFPYCFLAHLRRRLRRRLLQLQMGRGVVGRCLFGVRGRWRVAIPPVGHRFLGEVLAVGGSRPAMQSFVAFRGRKPSIDALLRHRGMVN